MSMFGGTAGYMRLDSWLLSNIVQLGMQRFCAKFLDRRNDPCGRMYDQMTMAARSGCANNAEGSARRATSRETEMRLTDVARASLAELAGDYLNWLMRQEKVPWPKESEQAREIYGIRLDDPDYDTDLVHDACAHILAQKKKFARWLDSDDDEVMANAMLILIARVIHMLNQQMEHQGESFKEEGGFREKLSGVRIEARGKQEGAPECPECGKAMARRKARSGRNVGGEFWGCTGYPECTGTREVEGSRESRESSWGGWSKESIKSIPSINSKKSVILKKTEIFAKRTCGMQHECGKLTVHLYQVEGKFRCRRLIN